MTAKKAPEPLPSLEVSAADRVAFAHRAAMSDPRPGVERAIVNMLAGLNEYAQAHRAQFGSDVGRDGVLGAHYADMCRALLGLLHGDAGRLDRGLLARAIREAATTDRVALEPRSVDTTAMVCAAADAWVKLGCWVREETDGTPSFAESLDAIEKSTRAHPLRKRLP